MMEIAHRRQITFAQELEVQRQYFQNHRFRTTETAVATKIFDVIVNTSKGKSQFASKQLICVFRLVFLCSDLFGSIF
jgi:hypothetical protein